MGLKVGLLYSVDTKLTPYQVWCEEELGADVTLINSRSEIVNQDIDLLVLVGGADVNPSRYGQKPSLKTGQPNISLEWWDENILPQYIQLAIEKKLAIFGICRGFQTLNVAFGGDLTQDIPQAYSNAGRHELVDDILLTTELFAYKREGKTILKIKSNSLHHQGLYKSQLGKGLVSIGTNEKYRNVEFLAHRTAPIGAMQGHAEETNCSFTNSLIRFILDKTDYNK